MNKEELTTTDIAQLLGAAKLIKKYAHHLSKHVDAAVTNFESTDCDHVQFLADTQYILDNCGVIDDCTLMVKKAIRKMNMQIKEDAQ